MRVRRKGKPSALVVGMQLVTITVEKIKNKIELPYDLGILLLGFYPKKLKTLIQKTMCIPMFISMLFTTANT